MATNESGRGGELSADDLEAFDMLLALARQGGRDAISKQDLVYFWPFVAVVLREAVKWAVRTSICVAQGEQLDESAPFARIAANFPDEISLDQLLELRDRYREDS